MKSLFTFACLISFFLVFCQQEQKEILDVRQELSNAPSIPLDGKWEFYWGQLIDSSGAADQPFTLFELPGIWTEKNFENGEPYPSFGYASFTKTIVLDPSIPYAIYTPAVYNSYRFLINGQLVSENGIVSASKAASVPFWHSETNAIDPAILKDTNEFVLQISNFHHFKGGTVDQIILGKKDELLYQGYLVEIYDTFLTGALIMGGLFFLGLYFFGRKQSSMLYFSLLCLTISYYIFGSGNYVLHGLLSDYPWQIAIRVEYITIYLITILLVKFTDSLYPDETPKQLVKVILIIAGVYIGFALFLPTHVFPRLHNYFLIILLLVILFGVYIYIRAVINKRIGSIYSLIGALFILTVFMVRVLNQLYPFELPVYVVALGYMVFFFLHSLTLSQKFAIAWKQARDNAEQALKAKSNFLSTMSHEIRTPMNAVIGLTNHLIEDNPKKEHKEVLDTLKFSSKNLLVLINDILDYSKIESNKVVFDSEVVRLDKLIENLRKVFEPIAAQKDIALVVEFDEDIPSFVECDPTRTSQVLTNLIGNAIKFTETGSVTIRVKLQQLAKHSCNILFEVIDTGIGIPDEMVDNIFESFTQASSSTTKNYGGTGLGLSISKKLLDLQGVELSVESKEGQGSRFYFEQLFKTVEKDLQRSTEESIPSKMQLKASVLLVEDNDVNILVAMKFLSKWGLTVDVAKNGQEALDQLAKQSYDIILMDVQMPVMDGYVASQKIRKSKNEVPIIALTASALPEEREQMFASGMNDYVLKPFEPGKLFETLTKHVEASKN